MNNIMVSEKQPHLLVSPSLFPGIYCHWTMDHLLLFFFNRQICHGDGCHPGHLTRASHPCSENGRPLRARRTSQTDVEAGGGGSAAGAGLNAELLEEMLRRWWQKDLLPSHVSSIQVIRDNCEPTSQHWTADSPECQAPKWEVGCKSDEDFVVFCKYLNCKNVNHNNQDFSKESFRELLALNDKLLTHKVFSWRVDLSNHLLCY